MRVKTCRISKKPKFIICTNFKDELVNYMVDKLDTLNKYCDVGIWNVKYNNL